MRVERNVVTIHRKAGTMLRTMRERRVKSVVDNVERVRERRNQSRTGFVPDVISRDGQIGIEHTVTVLLRIHIRSARWLDFDLLLTTTISNCNLSSSIHPSTPSHSGLSSLFVLRHNVVKTRRRACSREGNCNSFEKRCSSIARMVCTIVRVDGHG